MLLSLLLQLIIFVCILLSIICLIESWRQQISIWGEEKIISGLPLLVNQIITLYYALEEIVLRKNLIDDLMFLIDNAGRIH